MAKGLRTPDLWARFGDAGRASLIAAAAALPLKRRDFDGSFDALTSVLATSAVCKAIKPFVPERRPNGEDWNSFPSQHAAESFAGALAVRRYFGDGAGAAAIGIGTLVSASRLFARKHYARDIVAGIIIGTAVTALVAVNARRMSIRAGD